MNFIDYNFSINNPENLNERLQTSLSQVVQKFPYFQSARVLHLKQLFNNQSYRYNVELKAVAALTTDRSVLFDFITSNDFVSIHRNLFQAKAEELLNISVSNAEIIVANNSQSKLENSIKLSIENAIPNKTESDILELGKPLEFTTTEKHSFQEWLQLSRFNPIDRGQDIISPKLKHESIIDKFIAANPKIPALQKTAFIPIINANEPEKTHLMTETLAKVYLEQKKFDKAVQAYEILILKYPEKSSFFAIQISNIKKLQ